MVFAVFLLFTVSTLAAHIHAVPTRDLRNVVQHACEGQTLCDIKPEDYPQEEMDHFVAQNLHHLHRMKRETGYEPIEDPTNNCVASSERQKVFTITTDSGISERVIQSGLFEQTVPKVECQNEDAACFENITTTGYENETKYVCETVRTDVFLLVLAEGKPELRPSRIPTDCMCVKKGY